MFWAKRLFSFKIKNNIKQKDSLFFFIEKDKSIKNYVNNDIKIDILTLRVSVKLLKRALL